MISITTLNIRLTRAPSEPRSGETRLNEVSGGPESLLGWLETQLGLGCDAIHRASRISEYAAALDTVTDSIISKSLATDRWASAAELLARREDLLLAGWDETDNDMLPPLVRDLARAANGRKFVFPGEAGRLQLVLIALETGQQLPAHQCLLGDPPEKWPPLWQRVLAKVTVKDATDVSPMAPTGTALRTAQELVRGGVASEFTQDESLRYAVARSDTVACDCIASMLAATPDLLKDTVICCEDDATALRLDACLKRRGLSTTGASFVSNAHPALQVLPLTLALCWEPVDPQALLDFLTLPLKPLAGRAAMKLARAVSEEPGLGSSKWEKALEDLSCDENDPDGKTRSRVDAWLCSRRVARGSPIPSRLIRERCSLVAQWATGRALMTDADSDASRDLISALQVAAGQATLLGELVESQGTEVTEPQLGRLLEEAFSQSIETMPCVKAHEGPTRIRSLAEIDSPCRRLVWLGVGTADAVACRWTTRDLRQLRGAGVAVDDGGRRVSALRSAEARGLSRVRESLLAVLLPKDWERRWHPLWLAVRAQLQGADSPPVIDDLIAAGDFGCLAPYSCESAEYRVQQPQPPRALWSVEPQHLTDRETVSATELQDRLGCPVKWALNYLAKIKPSQIATLPDPHQLRGTFCHRVLERVFGAGGRLPTPDEAAERIGRVFDERLPLDAAPLAQTDQLLERQTLRRQLVNAARILVKTLAAGEYQIVGIELQVEAEAFGKHLNGSIDCVAAREDGKEAVIDFKYAGRKKFRKLIEDGKAVQLATYAYARSQGETGFPAVAYLVLAEGLLFTPSASPVEGDGNRTMLDGPAIQTVWDRFAKAIEVADTWVTSGGPIPARPLQGLELWPDGSRIVLETNLKPTERQDVCRYCDFKQLCGLSEAQ